MYPPTEQSASLPPDDSAEAVSDAEIRVASGSPLRRWFTLRVPVSQREILASRYLAIVAPAVTVCLVVGFVVGTVLEGPVSRRVLLASMLPFVFAAREIERRRTARAGLLLLVVSLAVVSGLGTLLNGIYAFGFIANLVILSLVVPVYGVRGGFACVLWMTLTAGAAFAATHAGWVHPMMSPSPVAMAIGLVLMAVAVLCFTAISGSLSSEALARAHRHRREMKSARDVATEFHAVFEEAETFLSMVDSDGVLRRMNRKVRDAMGHEAAQAALGTRLVDAPFWDMEREEVDGFLAAALDGEVVQLELMRPSPTGERVIRISATPHRPARTEAVERVLIEARDVTEIVRARASLERTERLEFIGTLAGGIAHDFNNTLASIQISVDLLRSAGDADSTVLDRIFEATTRAGDLTQKLLAFGRADRFDARPLDPDALLESLTPLLRRACGDGVELRVELGCPESHAIVGDRTALENMLINLVANACDAMPDGGQLTITSGLEPASDGEPAQCVWSVSDTGHGIPPDLLDRVFEPFFTTRDVDRGTGLGLAAVHGTVEAHRGTIEVHSSARGTRFDVRLPVDDAPGELAPARPSSGFAFDPRALAALRRRILIVDDDESMRALLAAVLRHAGFETTTARDGIEAIEALASGHFDVVLTDVVMPNLDGVGVAAHVAELPEPPGLMLMSAFPRGDLGERLANVPFEFVRKPFQPAELLARLARLLPATHPSHA